MDFLTLQLKVERQFRANRATAASEENASIDVEEDCLPIDIRFIGSGNSGISFRGQTLPDFDDTTLAEIEYVLNPKFTVQKERITIEVVSTEPGQRTVLAMRWGKLDDPAIGFVTLKDAQPIEGEAGRYLLKLESQEPVADRMTGELVHFVIRTTIREMPFDRIRVVANSASETEGNQVVGLLSDR